MNAQDLKNSILQLAVQGKLVEQRPEEGTAKELLAQIKAEKEQLIKDKKIKKEKPLPEITEEEKPFEIPESWEWVRLGNVACINGGYAFKSTNYTQDGVRVIRISDFNERGFVNTKIVRHKYSEELESFLLEEKNILLCMTGGTVGKSYFVKELDEPMMTNQRVATIKIIGLVEEYINLLILSPVTQTVINYAKNSTNDNISMDTINCFMVPVPPLVEQKRIVAKIEEILPYIEQYDKAYTKLEAFNKKFPEDMKKSILQMAMQGKLVEQRPEEGTAEELYEQIVAEKTRLVKEGKIKKEKPLAEITEDEIPFEIPESWKWVRLGEIVSVYGGKRIPAGTKLTEEDTGHKYIRVADMKDGSVKIDDIKYISEEIYQKIKQYYITSNDVYITVAGTIGRVGTIPEELNMANLTENADKLVFNNLDKSFLCIMLSSNVVQYQIREATTQVGQPKLAILRIQKLVVPLPPLEEQKRIVAKLEQMLPYCDQLIK